MADTAHTHDAQFAEPIDSDTERRRKTEILHGLIRESRRIVFVTGAGLSTAAGIRDYRSGSNTVLKTGKGIWTEAKQKQEKGGVAASAPSPRKLSHKRKQEGEVESDSITTEHKSDETKELDYGDLIDEEYDEEFEQSTRAAVPTFTHRALVELEKCGKLHLVITQNGDNLHRLSGLAPSKLCEIHGCWWLEQCVECDCKYYSDARMPTPPTLLATAEMKAARSKLLSARLKLLLVQDESISDDEEEEPVTPRTRPPKVDPYDRKYTGHFCPRAECNSAPLVTTVIEFEDCCFDDDIIMTKMAIQESDLVIVLGSSVVVDPLRKLLWKNIWHRKNGQQKRKLVFINLQPTELKKDSALFIHALLDDVFRDLMKLMQIDVPPFALRRWIRVEQRAVDVGQMQLSVRGVMGSEFDADPIDLFKGVTLVLPSAVTSAKRQRRSRSAVAAAPSTAVAALIESSHSIEPVTGTHTFTVQSLPASQNAFTGVSFTLLLHFYGHKKETEYVLTLDFAPDQAQTIPLEFDLAAGLWRQLDAVVSELPPPIAGRRTAKN